MGRKLTPQEEEEWRYWKEKQENSFADRLSDAIDDSFESVSPERLIDNLASGLASSLSTRESSGYDDYRDYAPTGDINWRAVFLVAAATAVSLSLAWLGLPFWLALLIGPIAVHFLAEKLGGKDWLWRG